MSTKLINLEHLHLYLKNYDTLIIYDSRLSVGLGFAIFCHIYFFIHSKQKVFPQSASKIKCLCELTPTSFLVRLFLEGFAVDGRVKICLLKLRIITFNKSSK